MKKFLSSLLLASLVPQLATVGVARSSAELNHPLPQVVLTAPQSAVSSPQPQRFEPSKKSWDFAAKYVKKMTVDEKIGQLVHVGINAKFANRESSFFKTLQRDVVENKIGGIIFFGAPIYETTIIGNRMQELAKTPLLMSLDAETGIGMRFEDATNFPWAMAVAATGNPVAIASRIVLEMPSLMDGRTNKFIFLKRSGISRLFPKKIVPSPDACSSLFLSGPSPITYNWVSGICFLSAANPLNNVK